MQIHWLVARYQNRRRTNGLLLSYSGQGRALKLLSLSPKQHKRNCRNFRYAFPITGELLLSKLEKKGYITRTQSQNDKRVVEVTLTEQGRAADTTEKKIPTRQ